MCREIQRLEIAFKEPMATFKAGDVLAGSVQLDLVQEFKLKGIDSSVLAYLYTYLYYPFRCRIQSTNQFPH